MNTAASIRAPAEVTLTQHGGVGMVEMPSPHAETEVLSAIGLSKKLLIWSCGLASKHFMAFSAMVSLFPQRYDTTRGLAFASAFYFANSTGRRLGVWTRRIRASKQDATTTFGIPFGLAIACVLEAAGRD